MFEQNTFLADAIEHAPFADDADVSEIIAATRRTRAQGFQFPKRVWVAMLACYGVFFIAILAATGASGHARFAIIVSVLYTAMYFGVARIGSLQGGPEDASPLDRGQDLQTWAGPMSSGSVYSQVLIVPVVLAFFGIAIAAIIAFIA